MKRLVLICCLALTAIAWSGTGAEARETAIGSQDRTVTEGRRGRHRRGGRGGYVYFHGGGYGPRYHAPRRYYRVAPPVVYATPVYPGGVVVCR